MITDNSNWQVLIKPQMVKQLPKNVQDKLRTLVKHIEQMGPVRGNWPNYGKLKGSQERHHCHLKKGKPTYVAVWKVINQQEKSVEIEYVGTHEKAPY